jgi:hypothetical protein
MRQLPWLVSIALPPLLIGSFLLFPGSLAWLTGFHPLHEVEGQNLGWEKAADEKGTPRFLAERNRVELVVPREMKVGDFLDLYQVRYEHIRLQIGSQLGIGRAGDEMVLAAGQKLTLEMTPPGAGT